MENSSGPIGLAVARAPTVQRGGSLGLATIVRLAFRPVEAIDYLGNISLPRALGVHLVAAGVGVFVICGLAAWSETDVNAGRPFSERLGQTFFEIGRAFKNNPLVASAVAAAILVFVEGAFLVLAFLMMPWGAGDERLRDSFRHALGRVWLCTPRVLLTVFVVGLVSAEVDRRGSQWWRANRVLSWPTPPPVPTLAATDPGYAQAQTEFQTVLARYRKQVEAAQEEFGKLLRTRPWYLRNDDEVVFLVGFVVVLWLLWGVLTAVAVRREVPAINRPPMCDQCGYNLSTMFMDARCPECGLAVEESLGANVRPGCPWHRRVELGLGRAYGQCAREAVRNPARLGRQLPLLPAGTDHRRFLAWHLPFWAFLGWLIAVLCALADVGWSWDRMAQGGHLLAFVVVAAAFATCGVILPSLTASVVGVWERVRSGRNLLGGAIQIACYSAPHLTLVAAGSGLWLAAIIWLTEQNYLKPLELATRMDDLVLASIFWLGPTLMLVVRYISSIARGTAAMRFANVGRAIDPTFVDTNACGLTLSKR